MRQTQAGKEWGTASAASTEYNKYFGRQSVKTQDTGLEKESAGAPDEVEGF